MDAKRPKEAGASGAGVGDSAEAQSALCFEGGGGLGDEGLFERGGEGHERVKA